MDGSRRDLQNDDQSGIVASNLVARIQDTELLVFIQDDETAFGFRLLLDRCHELMEFICRRHWSKVRIRDEFMSSQRTKL
jgi:hypothetical protein